MYTDKWELLLTGCVYFTTMEITPRGAPCCGRSCERLCSGCNHSIQHSADEQAHENKYMELSEQYVDIPKELQTLCSINKGSELEKLVKLNCTCCS